MLLCLAPKSSGRAKMQQSYRVKQGNYLLAGKGTDIRRERAQEGQK